MDLSKVDMLVPVLYALIVKECKTIFKNVRQLCKYDSGNF